MYVKKVFLLFISAPPPSYESLFGRVKEARKNSSGILDFFKKLFILVLGTSTFGDFCKEER